MADVCRVLSHHLLRIKFPDDPSNAHLNCAVCFILEAFRLASFGGAICTESSLMPLTSTVIKH